MQLPEDAQRAFGIARVEHFLAHRHQRPDLGLRRCAGVAADAELGQQLVDDARQLAFAAIAGQVGDRLALVECVDGRDRLDPELGGDRLVVVDVDLDQLDALAGVIGGDLLEHRRQLLARPAPFRPEIEQHQARHRRLDDLFLELRDGFALGFAQAQGSHAFPFDGWGTHMAPRRRCQQGEAEACAAALAHARRPPPCRWRPPRLALGERA